jgi:hypothetical protein
MMCLAAAYAVQPYHHFFGMASTRAAAALTLEDRVR